jgi:mRNA-degrading endonuclease RelE of RelBE toxin-antitoxin system
MLQKIPDNILRNTNDRVKQFPQFRIVKLRIANSGQHLPKTDGFRLIYFVSLVSDEVVLLRVYPKRGPQKTIDLVESEYTRLEYELLNESEAHTLHQVDINNLLAEISTDDTLQGGS